MSTVTHKPPEPELTARQRALTDYTWLHNQLAGEIREAAGAAGLHVAERRRRLQQMLFALPHESFGPAIDQLLETGQAGPLDEAVGALAADAANRQLAAIGMVWRLSHAAQLDPDDDDDVVECWRPGDQEHDHAMCQDVAAELGEADPPLTVEQRAERKRARDVLRLAAVAAAAPQFVVKDGRPATWPQVEQLLADVPLVGEEAAALLRPVLPAPVADPALPATPADLFRFVAGGVDAGLPAPCTVHMQTSPADLSVAMQMDEGATGAVEAWAARFGVAAPEMRGKVHDGPSRRWQAYRTDNWRAGGPDVPLWRGWRIDVWCAAEPPDDQADPWAGLPVAANAAEGEAAAADGGVSA